MGYAIGVLLSTSVRVHSLRVVTELGVTADRNAMAFTLFAMIRQAPGSFVLDTHPIEEIQATLALTIGIIATALGLTGTLLGGRLLGRPFLSLLG